MSELYSKFLECGIITTDSRDCPAGSIFFALKGESFNGNQYAAAALEKGCAYAVIDEAQYALDDRYIVVPDVLTTLQQLANEHRRALGTPIIGITGTNGKTTTKELIATVLSQKYNVLYTQGNFNNHIGVPKTLLRLTPEHDIAVIEMGANHPGEIKTLVNIVEPNYGIITNVGKAHIEGFGSFEGVIRTKGELYDFLRSRKRAMGSSASLVQGVQDASLVQEDSYRSTAGAYRSAAYRSEPSSRIVNVPVPVKCSVSLEKVGLDTPFAKLEGSNNIVILHTERYNPHPLMIQGYGAGAGVTAAGVFADILDIVNV